MAKIRKSPKTDSHRRKLAETQAGIFGEKEQKKIEFSKKIISLDKEETSRKYSQYKEQNFFA